ncbi:MAG: hypothetical protein ACXVNF_02900, partial [Neobacillus sp.]
KEINAEQFDAKKIKQIKGAIDCFKIIHTCLKGYIDGQQYMYKPISSQLRTLFCETKRNKDGTLKKDESLIYRIHPDIKLLAFTEIKFEDQTSFPISIASMPYFITAYSDGIVDAKFDIAPPYRYISLEDWRNQVIDLEYTFNVEDIIRKVADQEASHLDDNNCPKLEIMRKHNPTNVGSNILFTIALAHYVIDLANQITPIWIQNKEINV